MITKATKAQALKALAKINATLDEHCAKDDMFVIDAPKGYVFVANDEHSWTAGSYNRDDLMLGWGLSMGEIWADIVNTCAEGLVKCTGQCSGDNDICDIAVAKYTAELMAAKRAALPADTVWADVSNATITLTTN